MMIVYSKTYTENYEKLRDLLKMKVWAFGHDRGINHVFMEDSRTINDSIELIASRVASLLGNTVLDTILLEFIDAEVKAGRYKREGD